MSTAPLNPASSASTSTKAAYQNVVKGKLVLKGKSKPTVPSSTASSSTPASQLDANKRKAISSSTTSTTPSSSTSTTTASTESKSTTSSTETPVTQVLKKTKAEEQFELIQQQKLEKLAKERASKSYRQAIEEYNDKLSKLSEHHDIPRVGPG